MAPLVDPPLPQRFGAYVLLRALGRGADDDFLLALKSDLAGGPRPCVVRRALEATAPGEIESAVDAVRLMTGLHHPNLVEVLDAGVIGGRRFVATTLVEGKDLRAIWNRCAEQNRRVPVDFALHVAREVASGLAYTHGAMGARLVHGQVSPVNILVGYDGQVRLTDLNPARAAREATGPGMLIGSLGYLAPEQARGEAIDARADIYALAVVLWEMLTGRQLLGSSHRSTASTIAAARNPHIRPPSELARGLPEGVDAVVGGALVVEPSGRYASVERFRARLSELLARAFPGYDAGCVGAFMRELFAREHEVETRELAGYLQEEISRIRGQERSGEGERVADADDPTRRRQERSAATPGGGMGREDAQALAPREVAERRRGTVIAGRYRIEDLLSFDGMGALYRARDLTVGKPCALRVLPESYSRDPELSSRFLRDVQAATELGHPNIIEVLDSGRLEDGSVFSAMELLDGQSIAAVLADEGRLSPSRAVHVGSQICRALGSAHENGIIHRDLKPESVMLVAHEGDLDVVKVVDFGICKHVAGDGGAAGSLIIGTPDYMAPELATGVEATAASDIYALGTILFEMLGGARPFTGKTALEVLRQKGAQEPPRVDASHPEIPRPLAEVVARCMARRPEDRPESMRVLELELMRAIDPANRPAPGSIDLPPPPEAGSLRVPVHVASAAVAQEAPVSPRAPAPPPVSVVNATPASPPPPSLTASTSALARALVEPEVAAEKAGRSIVPIAVIGAVAVAVVLFVWPGVLRERGDGPAGKGPEVAEGVAPKKGEDPGKAGASGAHPPDPSGAQVDPSAGREPATTTGVAEAASAGSGDVVPAATTAGVDAGEVDVVVVAAKLDLAVSEGRWREPAGDNAAEFIATLAAADPKNEAIKRARKQASDVLVARGEIAASEKRWHDAVEHYRDLRALVPDHKALGKSFVEALQQDAKILRYIKDWAQILEVADDLIAVNPKSLDARMMRGEALEELGRWTEAAEAYKGAKALKPKDKGIAEAIKRVEKRAKAAGTG